jgi:hypothetical protein
MTTDFTKGLTTDDIVRLLNQDERIKVIEGKRIDRAMAVVIAQAKLPGVSDDLSGLEVDGSEFYCAIALSFHVAANERADYDLVHRKGEIIRIYPGRVFEMDNFSALTDDIIAELSYVDDKKLVVCRVQQDAVRRSKVRVLVAGVLQQKRLLFAEFLISRSNSRESQFIRYF